MQRQIFVFACMLALGLAVPARMEAQESVPDAVIQRPARSIALTVGESVVIGYWMRMSERADLGLEIGGGINRVNEDDRAFRQTSVAVGPGLKWYMATSGPLAPYAYGSIQAGYTRDEREPDSFDTTRYSLDGRGGIGLDWIPARGVSVGGHVGIGAGYFSGSREIPSVPGTSDEYDFDGWFARTFASGIRVHLYF
jgi:hypothetical protein